MPSLFSHSLRTLRADRFSGSITGILIAAVLLGAWGLWAVFARVTLYEVSDAARLEADQQVHPIQASAAGRVMATRLRLDQEVQAGEVLVELDASQNISGSRKNGPAWPPCQRSWPSWKKKSKPKNTPVKKTSGQPKPPCVKPRSN